MICVIDNYDSFTFNLVQILWKNKFPVEVLKNDQVSLEQLKQKKYSAFLLSPGPGHPSESGICRDLVKSFYKTTPIFGVCLGHQIICEFFGAKVINASQIMHGRVSPIFHDETKLYRDIPNPFKATRYHSLLVDFKLPECLLANSWTQSADGQKSELMGASHATLPICGVQFHPESIMSEMGEKLVLNFFANL